jgi:hypothetical protein
MPNDLVYELRHAARSLARDRGFTAVVLLSLALGIGANTAIFSLVDQVLVQRLPARKPQELVLLSWKGSFPGSGGDATATATCCRIRSTASWRRRSGEADPRVRDDGVGAHQ